MRAKQAISEKRTGENGGTNLQAEVLKKEIVPLRVSDEVLHRIAEGGIKIGRCPECGSFGGVIVIKMPTFQKNELFVQSSLRAYERMLCDTPSNLQRQGVWNADYGSIDHISYKSFH